MFVLQPKETRSVNSVQIPLRKNCLNPITALVPDCQNFMLNTSTSGSRIQEETETGKFIVRAATTTDEIEELRPYWQAIDWFPNAQIDYFSEINKIWEDRLTPYILVLERDGNLSGMLIGRIGIMPFKCNIGYKSVSLGKVKQFTILYGGVLGCDDERHAQAMILEIKRMLAQREVEVVNFNLLDTASHIFKLATREPGIFVRDHLTAPQLHWRVKLPSTAIEFLQRLNKKHRYWLNRLERQLEKDFPGQVAFRSLTDGCPLKDIMHDVESVSQKTYQRKLGAQVNNIADDVLEEKLRWSRVYVIYLANSPSAFWMGRLYKEVFYSDATGYDPEFRKHELGTVVFMRMIDCLCREGVKTIDFGLGDALYKQRFGDQSWNEASVKIFAPRLSGLVLNLARTAIDGTALSLQRLLERVHLKQRFKTFWRKRLKGDGKE